MVRTEGCAPSEVRYAACLVLCLRGGAGGLRRCNCNAAPLLPPCLVSSWAQWRTGQRKDFLELRAKCSVMLAFATVGAQTRAFGKSPDFSGPGFIPALFILCRLCSWGTLCAASICLRGFWPSARRGGPWASQCSRQSSWSRPLPAGRL